MSLVFGHVAESSPSFPEMHGRSRMTMKGRSSLNLKTERMSIHTRRKGFLSTSGEYGCMGCCRMVCSH